MVREIFKQIAERQAQGVIFHSDMADYYAFLNLIDLKNFHDCQCCEENETFRKIKNYYILKYHKTLITNSSFYASNITPSDWYDKTSLDVDESAIETLLQESLNYYLTWETETCDLYKNYANQLFDAEEYESYHFVRTLVDDVEKEKNHIMDLMVDLSAVNYDIHKIKGLQYKLYNK